MSQARMAEDQTFIHSVLSELKGLLIPRLGVNQAAVEAEQILIYSHFFVHGRLLSRLELYSSRQTREWTELARAWAEKRTTGYPLQYLTGYQNFMGQEYRVGPGVLVPRPETESLVELAAKWLEARPNPKLGMEIGLGSGVITIELLKRFPDLKIVATEVADLAIEFSKRNAMALLGPGFSRRLKIIPSANLSQVIEPLIGAQTGLADFLICNPPYLMSSDLIEAQVREHEPHEALFSPRPDPLFFYREIADHAHALLKPNGVLFFEIASERADETERLFTEQGWQSSRTHDLAGRERFLIVERHHG